MPVTLNGRTWQLSDFAPWGFARNWMPFFEDLGTELSRFRGGNLRDQAALSALTAASSASTAVSTAGTAGSRAARGLVYPAVNKSLVTTGDVVATFVYDTRRDSDGGAWTGKCQGTSWYNEGLNTATRGATRRFPTVALIVRRGTTGNSVTIYDAHDLDASGVPRMWMVFAMSAANLLLTGGDRSGGIAALNGRVYLPGDNGAGGEFHEIDFVGDGCLRRTGASGARYGGTIAQRNAGLGYLAVPSAVPLASSRSTWASAMVLPGAPLDRLGLPIPTVAVATAGGVSVIHPWGAVYDRCTDFSVARTWLSNDGSLTVYRSPGSNYGSLSTDGRGLVYKFSLPYADAASAGAIATYRANSDIPAILSGNANHVPSIVVSDRWLAVGKDVGLSIVAEDLANPANGMVSYTTTAYATGWQPGDIRGAWLCDTAAGSVGAAALLSYDGSTTTGWTVLNSASLSIVSGALRITYGGASNPGAFVSINTVPGVSYLLTVDYGLGTAGAVIISVVDTATGGGLGAKTLSTGAKALIGFVATGTVTQIQIFAATATTAQYADFDNVSCRLAVADRSYKGRGLVVNGTLTRTALPCGLAAVSGFSATNYLEQPYNPDLDFGTGDFSVSAWILLPPGQAGGIVFSRANGPNPSILLAVTSTMLFRTRLDGGNEFNVTVSRDIRGAGWTHVTVIRRGTAMEAWLDGVLVGTMAVTAVNLSDTSARCRWGDRVDISQPFDGGSIALARITAYAPTPAQIRRMYDDERALIVGGTPATLGGTSNNVTALSANDATGTLAVGTGDGVSVFDGLGRVAYLDAANATPAIGNDDIRAVSANGAHMLIGTSANAGIISDSVIARDRLLPASPVPGIGGDVQVITMQGVTLDATLTHLSPRLYVGEREAVSVDVTIQARSTGASASQGAQYRRQARYTRDAGGNVTLNGVISPLINDQETNAAMDATLFIDTASQTISVQVTGVANTRIAWTARLVVTRIAEDVAWPA